MSSDEAIKAVHNYYNRMQDAYWDKAMAKNAAIKASQPTLEELAEIKLRRERERREAQLERQSSWKPGWFAQNRALVPIGRPVFTDGVVGSFPQCRLCHAPSGEECSPMVLRSNQRYGTHAVRYGFSSVAPQLANLVRQHDCGVCQRVVCDPDGFHFFRVKDYLDHDLYTWLDWLRRNEGDGAVELEMEWGILSTLVTPAEKEVIRATLDEDGARRDREATKWGHIFGRSA